MLNYFTDAILRGPTIGSMLMCLAAALIGCIIFLRKQSLIGETLSHAAYPGVILGVIFGGLFSFDYSNEIELVILIMVGAFLTACLGLWAVQYLERRFHIRSDSALCFVLSAFFGIGLTLASEVQFSNAALYRQALTYLYGQAATMSDVHIWIYGILALCVVLVIIFFDKELVAITFNREFAQSIGINVRTIDLLIFLLTTVAVVIGIRSVGVVLMSAMLIAPAAASRQYTHKFHFFLAIAGLIGLLSGFFGNYLSVELTQLLYKQYPGARLAVPTGPAIVLVASIICVFSLLFAPERGLVQRIIRITKFRHQCLRENILKAMWRFGKDDTVSLEKISKYLNVNRLYLRFLIYRLTREGWLKKTTRSTFKLTLEGYKRASRIVRLHRLWEVYLVDYLGVGVERVHRNAEEMEHIITPELERQLTLLLKNPELDPHQQRIPPSKEVL